MGYFLKKKFHLPLTKPCHIWYGMAWYGMASYLNFTTILKRRKHCSDFPLCIKGREGLERRSDLSKVEQPGRGLDSTPQPKPTVTPHRASSDPNTSTVAPWGHSGAAVETAGARLLWFVWLL